MDGRDNAARSFPRPPVAVPVVPGAGDLPPAARLVSTSSGPSRPRDSEPLTPGSIFIHRRASLSQRDHVTPGRDTRRRRRDNRRSPRRRKSVITIITVCEPGRMGATWKTPGALAKESLNSTPRRALVWRDYTAGRRRRSGRSRARHRRPSPLQFRLRERIETLRPIHALSPPRWPARRPVVAARNRIISVITKQILERRKKVAERRSHCDGGRAPAVGRPRHLDCRARADSDVAADGELACRRRSFARRRISASLGIAFRSFGPGGH